jgi:hypothetical protein
MEMNMIPDDCQSINLNDEGDPSKEIEPKIIPNKNSKKFNKIIKNYKQIHENIQNTFEDIQKLEKIHTKFVSNAENKMRFHEYGTYIDDIYFQIGQLNLEYNCQSQIQIQNINKFYKDLYRLYHKVVKKLVSIKFENGSIQMTGDKKFVLDKMRIEKKQFFSKVKPYSEIEENHIQLDDCLIIYNEIEVRLSDLVNSINNIVDAILNVEEQRHEGVFLQTYLISLRSEKEKAEIEHNVYSKILLGILESHLQISNKYLDRTSQISKEIADDAAMIHSRSEIISSVSNSIKPSPLAT